MNKTIFCNIKLLLFSNEIFQKEVAGAGERIKRRRLSNDFISLIFKTKEQFYQKDGKLEKFYTIFSSIQIWIDTVSVVFLLSACSTLLPLTKAYCLNINQNDKNAYSCIFIIIITAIEN